MEVLFNVGKKVINTFNYVELSIKNFETFSNEFIAIIQLVGAELDNFFKVFCNFNGEASMANYKTFIKNNRLDIINKKIEILSYDISLYPFKEWSTGDNKLDYWNAYTDIKHHRIDNIERATLGHCINILAALYLLEMDYFEQICKNNAETVILDEESHLFELQDYGKRYIKMENIAFALDKE